MSGPLPDPTGLIQGVLTELAVRAVERVWTLSFFTRFRRDPIEAAVHSAIQEVNVSDLSLYVEPALLERFLSSPDVAGIVDRLLAFRLLRAEDDGEEHSSDGGDQQDRLDAQQRKIQWELERVRENQGGSDLSEPSSSERLSAQAQEEALRRECSRVTELWLGAEGGHEVPHELVYSALTGAADAAYEAVGPSRKDGADIRPNLRRWLDSVEPRLRMLDQVTSIQPFLEFENQLRVQVAEEHKWLRAPHLGREVRVEWGAAYVDPWFGPRDTSRGEHDISATELMARLDRAVVLGDPGAGKSSFAESVCSRIATRYDKRLVAGRRLTPMLVVLRNHAVDLRRASMAQILENVSRSVYQVDPPDGAVKYLLAQGRLLVLFDGLDELRDLSDRQRMRNAIESFCNFYPMTHVLVTARNIGYEYAQLRSSEFRTFVLREFSDEQISLYARRWFELQDDFPRVSPARRAASFLEESEQHASDLRRNPLLLALLCGVYGNQGTLPTSRPDIYKRCIELLLKQWDSLRQIEVVDPLESHLERTLRQVANWLYNEPGLGLGMPESMLVRRCAAYLEQVRTEDLEEATKVAQSFVDFCRDRAWVLVKTGSNKDGEDLFGFAHRTFLEYFAAQYIEKRSRTPGDLADTLIELIDGSPSVIPHLALQLADDSREAGDEILSRLLSDSEEEIEGVQERLLLFVVEALRFLVPKPGTTRRLARETALGLIKPTLVDTTRYDGSIESTPWPAVGRRLGAIAEPNVRAASVGFADGLTRAPHPGDRQAAMEVLRNGIDQQPAYLREAWSRCYPELLLDAVVDA